MLLILICLNLGFPYAKASDKAQNEQAEVELFKAILESNIPQIKKLIDQGLDVNQFVPGNYRQGGLSNPLFDAVINSKYKVVDFLLENGANLEARNENGMTALGIAAWSNDLDMVKYLIEKGAKINVSRLDINPANSSDAINSSEEPLYWAIAHGNVEMAKYLLSRGAKIKTGNNGIGQAGLLWGAIRWGHLEALILLIENGIDVNVKVDLKNPRNSLPIFEAIEARNPAMLEILIKAGASTDVKNIEGKTPRQVIEENLSKLEAMKKIMRK